MEEDPFDKARRDMERARRAFEERMDTARGELERTGERCRADMAEARGRFDVEMARARQRIEAAWNASRPHRPGRDEGSGEPGAEPEPAPVRPNNPSNLSGGAEAPLP